MSTTRPSTTPGPTDGASARGSRSPSPLACRCVAGSHNTAGNGAVFADAFRRGHLGGHDDLRHGVAVASPWRCRSVPSARPLVVDQPCSAAQSSSATGKASTVPQAPEVLSLLVRSPGEKPLPPRLGPSMGSALVGVVRAGKPFTCGPRDDPSGQVRDPYRPYQQAVRVFERSERSDFHQSGWSTRIYASIRRARSVREASENRGRGGRITVTSGYSAHPAILSIRAARWPNLLLRNGAPCRNRTDDTSLTMAVLCRLS
jgi:hypothetical protein